MLGGGSPEALQLRVNEDLFLAAFVANTTVSSGSWMNLGGMPETAWREATGGYKAFVGASQSLNIEMITECTFKYRTHSKLRPLDYKPTLAFCKNLVYLSPT